MENIKQADTKFLLERGLEDLHVESETWMSQIELWKIELSFFQKLLDKHSIDFPEIDQKKKIDHFQNLIIYYNYELLDEFRKEVRKHEKFLAKQFYTEERMEESSYRKLHWDLSNRLDSFRKEYRRYKKEFFSFIEKAL